MKPIVMERFDFARESAHVLKSNRGRVLLHIPSSGIFRLSNTSHKILEIARELNSFTSDEVMSRFDPSDRNDALNGFEELASIGVIRREQGGEATSGVPEVRNFPLSTIVLNVTTGCNLSCTYCYKEDLDKPSSAHRMSLETAQRGIDLLIQQGAERELLNVIFFGGEPLSNMPLIREIVAYAEAKCSSAGKAVEFSLTTNATLLTEEHIDFLGRHRFGISVSLDGPETVNDRRRRTVKGAGTYQLVAEKVRLLLDRYTARPIGARVTVTSGYTDVVAIHRHLKEELGFAEVGFAPVTSSPTSSFNLRAGELREFFNSMRELGVEYVRQALMGTNIGFSNMHQLLNDLHEGRKKALPCGAGVGLLSVDARGDLNLCHRFTGSDLETFGSVTAGIDTARLSRFVGQALDRSERSCNSCRIRNLCSGGCYHESYVRSGDPFAPVYEYCELLREWVDFGIESYLTLLDENPRFISKYIANRRREA